MAIACCLAVETVLNYTPHLSDLSLLDRMVRAEQMERVIS